jgi:hypothetical protein
MLGNKQKARPGRLPIPRHPAARIKKSLQVEATTCRDPGTVDCPGFFSVAVKTLSCRCADFAGVCVVLATLLVYCIRGRQMDGADDIVSD